MMTWNAVAIVGSTVARGPAVAETWSGALNLTVPLVPSATVVCVLPFWFVIFVLDETANVIGTPLSSRPWKFECVAVIVIEPSAVVVGAV